MISDFELGRLSLFLQLNLTTEQAALMESQCAASAEVLNVMSMVDGVPGPTAALMIAKGHSITTIKELRQATGMALKEAKDWVDTHCPRKN